MHKDFYHQPKQNFKVDITLPKFLVIVITVMAFFVIPVQVISLAKTSRENSVNASNTISYNNIVPTSQQPNSNFPRVAGDSTAVTSNPNQSSGNGIDFSDKSTQYAVLGIFFMSISFISLAYLFVVERQNKEVDIL